MLRNSTHLKESKVVQILIGLSKKELKSFSHFVASPYFNTNPRLVDLSHFVLEFAPDFEAPSFTLEQAFHTLFPDRNYRKDTIVKLFSKLFKLAETFVMVEAFKAKEWRGKVDLLNFYNDQNLGDLFEWTHQGIRKSSEKFAWRNYQYYQSIFALDAANSQFLSTKKDYGVGDVYFQEMTNSLDAYYLVKKLELLCQMKNRQQTVPFEYTFDLAEEILAYLPDSPYFELPAIQIWYYAYLLLDQPQANHYHALKKRIQMHGALLTKEENRVIYTYLENSCKVVATDLSLYYELFNLYQSQLTNEIIYVNGYLPPMIFRNIVTVALKLKELHWVDQFLNNHGDKILPSYAEREDIYSLCKTLLLFEKGEWHLALDYLNQLKYANIYTKLDERRIRLKIYYELGWDDPLEDLINSFRKFLTTNKAQIEEGSTIYHRNFISVLSAIHKLQTFNEAEQELIRSRMKGMDLLVEREWLEGKLESI